MLESAPVYVPFSHLCHSENAIINFTADGYTFIGRTTHDDEMDESLSYYIDRWRNLIRRSYGIVPQIKPFYTANVKSTLKYVNGSRPWRTEQLEDMLKILKRHLRRGDQHSKLEVVISTASGLRARMTVEVVPVRYFPIEYQPEIWSTHRDSIIIFFYTNDAASTTDARGALAQALAWTAAHDLVTFLDNNLSQDFVSGTTKLMLRTDGRGPDTARITYTAMQATLRTLGMLAESPEYLNGRWSAFQAVCSTLGAQQKFQAQVWYSVDEGIGIEMSNMTLPLKMTDFGYPSNMTGVNLTPIQVS